MDEKIKVTAPTVEEARATAEEATYRWAHAPVGREKAEEHDCMARAFDALIAAARAEGAAEAYEKSSGACAAEHRRYVAMWEQARPTERTYRRDMACHSEAALACQESIAAIAAAAKGGK